MVPKLKITAIKPYPVWVGIRNQLIVKVETDQGVYGWGESGLSSREKAVVGAIEHYSEFLIGQDAMQIGRIWQEMYRSQYFEGGRVLQAAISAIDIALHDIKGKALGVPVYELLGGKQRDLIPTFATTRSEASSAEVVEQVLELKAQGWEAIRLIPAGQRSDKIYEPRESIAETAKWTVKCREALGDEVVLGIDFHHRLSVAEAASYCQKMPRGTLDFLEEPIRDETPGAYAALRKLTDVPFAIGEEFSSKWQFLPFIEGDLTQFNRIDICNVGGLTEAMKVAGWTEAHYIDMMPHNPLAPSAPPPRSILRPLFRTSPGSRRALRRASFITASTIPNSSPDCSRSKGPTIASVTSRASASTSTRLWSRSKATGSGKPPTSCARTVRSPTGRRPRPRRYSFLPCAASQASYSGQASLCSG